MNNFISNLLDRHIHTERNVKPLLRARFDAAPDLSMVHDESILSTEKDDLLQTESSLSTKEWKPSPGKNKIDNTHQPATEGEIRPLDRTLLIADAVTLKRSEQGKKPESAENEVGPVKKPEESHLAGKQFSMSHDENPTGLQNKYTKKKYDTRSFYKKLTDAFAPLETGSQKQIPLIKELENPNLIGDDEIEKNKRSNIYPASSGKRLDDHKLRQNNTETNQVINVSIGSIEVRANFPVIEPKTVSKKEPRNLLSLEQYLEQAKSGRR